MLEKDVSFTLSITYIFVAGAVAIEMILGFLLALLFNREMRGRSVLRTIITLPIFAHAGGDRIPGPDDLLRGGGPVDSFLRAVRCESAAVALRSHLGAHHDDDHRRLAVDTLVFIIALAGLQGLPQDVTRSVRGRWRRLVVDPALHHPPVDGADSLADPPATSGRCLQGLRSGRRHDAGWSGSGHPVLLLLQLPDREEVLLLRRGRGAGVLAALHRPGAGFAPLGPHSPHL